MSTIVEWLQGNVPGFKHLVADERSAITDFSLLWSLFEARVLDTEGSVRKIRAVVVAWHVAGILDADIFAPELTYF